MRRQEAVKAFVELLASDDLVICCNGMVGRELFTERDRPQNFYMIGSMSLGLSIGVGVALCQPERRVFVLDGDGNVLMGLSSLATAATESVPRLIHVVLDNGMHASTGGQRTVSDRVRLEQVALAAGYRAVERTDTLDGLRQALRKVLAAEPDGPVMVLAKVEPGNVKGIGRVEPTPAQLAQRFARQAQRPVGGKQ